MVKELGVEVGQEQSVTGLTYLSRFYRLRDGATEPNRQPFNGGDLGYLKFAVFGGDNRTFSVTLAPAADDAPMRALRDERHFDAATNAIPVIKPWVDPETAEPISGVSYMGNLINRVRRLVVDGKPSVLGLLAVGDASVCTNPAYGRGCALGFVQGVMFADALAEHGDEPERVAQAFDEATGRELVPWYEAAVMQDAANAANTTKGSPSLTFAREHLRAASVDASVSRTWMRTLNLLTTPDALIRDPDFFERVRKVSSDKDAPEPEALKGPRREALLEAIKGAEP
jgi:2-polyprenyl-6-methoxyphenol hydroxylase-like FAD-dependent oxidoreductase